MAVIEKRGDAYRVRITRKGHKRLSETFATRARAEAWAAKTEGEILAGQRGEIIRRTVVQALERYRDEVAPTHRGSRWERVRCDKLARDLPFRNRPLPELRPRDIAAWRDSALLTLAPASVRREMGLVRLVFEQCRLEWGWLHVNPMDGVKRPLAPAARKRVASDAEIDRIVGKAAGDLQTRVAVVVRFALETAMRAGEIVSLTRESIHGRYVTLPKTKNGDSRDVPLSSRARAILEQYPDGFGLSSAQLDVHFRLLRAAAEVPGLHFHDLRATAITRLAKRLEVLELARMIGHRDLKSLMVYYRTTAEELSDRLD